LSGITAILPAFNEEVSIGSMAQLANQYPDRVMVIDDESHNRTAEVSQPKGAPKISSYGEALCH
jgi:glycosyltransferase involved in cell wall biosynthesis